LPILAVPSHDGCPPHPARSCQKTPLAAQIYSAIREGIENGRLTSGARLPSWRDLAAQLCVSRGTVRVAYERLIAEQLAIGLGPAGTRVAGPQSPSSMPDRSQEVPLLPDLFYEFGSAPLIFQMGVPSQDAFPFKLWSRILTRETRRAAAAPVTYPDPRGDPELRKEVTAYLGLARGIRCGPSQVLIIKPVTRIDLAKQIDLFDLVEGVPIEARACPAAAAQHLAPVIRLMRTVALIGQERTSKIMLNGVSVARRKRLKPASVAT
jgi:Bacterial regulatory proteins, gntR family